MTNAPAIRTTAVPHDKAGKFKTIAERRMSNLLRTLKHIGNLSNRTSYEYTPEQISKMFKTLRSELDECEAKFKRVEFKKSGGFSFD